MEKRKPSAKFQNKARKEVKKRKTIRPSDVINVTYKGVELCLIGEADRLAWEAMDREYKKKHIANIKEAIFQKKFKPLVIEYETANLPGRIMIYVPCRYEGTGHELLDIPRDDKEKRGIYPTE